MTFIYVDIELTNTFDEHAAVKGMINPNTVKKMTVTALVDSGAYMFCINEVVKNQLDLPTIGFENAQLANGHIEQYEIVGPVTIRFENRNTICRAFVLPGDAEILLGAIPMEDMDVLIHPRTQQLVVNPAHPNIPQKSLK